MGQTLTHGVYLPDEGERNCYNGLASNWSILDGAVGTIAEHTTALAGKAPAVHTHTKSDVTDLFNSANTWTQTNYFTKDITINSEAAANAQSALSGSKIRQIVFNDSSNSNYFFRFRQYVDATSSRMQFNAQGFDSNNQAYSATFVYRVNSDGSSVLYPGDNNQSLGTSGNQWNNLYAKNYYYNGVAWGLDKANVWTGSNTFTSITTKTNVDRTVAPTSDTYYGTITCRDKNGSAMFRMQGTIKTDLSNVWDMMLVAPNSTYQTFFKYTINSATLTKELRLKADSVIPDVNLENLGTTDNPWKTLNGINPGALSLPKGGTTENVDYYNIATAIKPSGGTSTNFSGAINYYKPTIDGWLSLVVTNCTDLSVWEPTINYGSIISGASRNRQVMVPVLANHTYEITIQGSAWYAARLMPCQGNV